MDDNPFRLRPLVMGTLFIDAHEKQRFDNARHVLGEALLEEREHLNVLQQELRLMAQTPVKSSEEVAFLRNWKEYEDSIFQYWGKLNELIKEINDLLKHTDVSGKVIIKNADEHLIYRIDNLVRKVNDDVASLLLIIHHLIEILHQQKTLYDSMARFQSADLVLRHGHDIEYALKRKQSYLKQLKKEYAVAWHEIESTSQDVL